MTDQTNLTQALAAQEQALQSAVEAAMLALNQLPQNPGIKDVSKSPRAFVVSSADVFKVDRWDPFFHDWKAQYQLVQSLLASRRFEVVRNLLQGKVHEDRQRGRISLAPQAIEHLKSVLGDLQFALEPSSALKA